MTAERFTVDSDGKYWDTVSNKYVTITHLFYLVEKLEKENVQLKRELDEFKQPNCKKCRHYSVDNASDYCMCENSLLNGTWEMFPLEWDYNNAKYCREYEE